MHALILDTETTGLIKSRLIPLEKQPEIVEFFGAVYDLKSGKHVKKSKRPLEIEQLFRPTRPMTEEVIKIHGITNEAVAGAPSFKSKAAAIKKFIEEQQSVIGHNLSFDKEMIDLEMQRCGLVVAWPRLICTVEQTVHLKGHRLNLSALHNLLFGEPFANAHRARVDVDALARCCTALHASGAL